MKLRNLKVRPRKQTREGPCATEFAAMLACWASSNDVGNTGACAESAKVLQQCMKNKAKSGPISRPTVNYHLARYSKHV